MPVSISSDEEESLFSISRKTLKISPARSEIEEFGEELNSSPDDDERVRNTEKRAFNVLQTSPSKDNEPTEPIKRSKLSLNLNSKVNHTKSDKFTDNLSENNENCEKIPSDKVKRYTKSLGLKLQLNCKKVGEFKVPQDKIVGSPQNKKHLGLTSRISVNNNNPSKRKLFHDTHYHNPIEAKAIEKENLKQEKLEEKKLKRAKQKKKKEKDMSVYDYRHYNGGSAGGASSSNSNDTIVPLSNRDNEEDEDNLMNNYNQRRFLGGTINSMSTLCNMGNSCYLNSVLYTLRFAPLFLHKLHHLVDDMRQVNQKVGQNKMKSSSLGRNVSGLQGQSGRSWSSKDLASLGGNSMANEGVPKNNRQIVTEKLHELYQNLNRNEYTENSEPFHAGTFLHSIQEVSSVFEGNQQQDAHELLMCILDSIRETCQSLIKIIKDHPDIIANGYATVPEVESTAITNSTQPAPPPPQSTMKLFFTRNKKRKDSTKSNLKPSSPMKDKDNYQQSSDINIINDTSFKNSSNSLNNSNSNANSDSNSDLNNFASVENEKLNEKIKKLGLDFFREDFEGVTLSTTKCLTCETVTEQKEAMIDIQIPIPVAENLTENPQLYFQNSCITREYFRTGDVFRCDVCCGYTEAIRSISFDILPRLLVLQLKRFSGDMEKINSYIPTPFVLKCFCNKCYKKKDDEKIHIYKLYSIITHVGATLTVGHYIAYTSLLSDFHTEYISCANDKRKFSLSQNNGSASNVSSEKNTGLVKKLIYGRNKASSSGDMSKSLKPINGLSKIMMNGIEKLNLNNQSSNQTSQPTTQSTICHGLNCCGIYMKDFVNYVENQTNNSENSSNDHHHSSQNSADSSHANGVKDNYSTWYMCDDDKIKVMSQREFEELLSPNQKLTITPYLLFYARYDIKEPSN